MTWSKTRKSLLIAFSALVILAIGSVAALITSIANANRAAEQFCASISVGETVEEVFNIAEQAKATLVPSSSHDSALFLFNTLGPARASCRVEIKNDRITNKSWRRASD